MSDISLFYLDVHVEEDFTFNAGHVSVAMYSLFDGDCYAVHQGRYVEVMRINWDNLKNDEGSARDNLLHELVNSGRSIALRMHSEAIQTEVISTLRKYLDIRKRKYDKTKVMLEKAESLIHNELSRWMDQQQGNIGFLFSDRRFFTRSELMEDTSGRTIAEAKQAYTAWQNRGSMRVEDLVKYFNVNRGEWLLSEFGMILANVGGITLQCVNTQYTFNEILDARKTVCAFVRKLLDDPTYRMFDIDLQYVVIDYIEPRASQAFLDAVAEKEQEALDKAFTQVSEGASEVELPANALWPDAYHDDVVLSINHIDQIFGFDQSKSIEVKRYRELCALFDENFTRIAPVSNSGDVSLRWNYFDKGYELACLVVGTVCLVNNMTNVLEQHIKHIIVKCSVAEEDGRPILTLETPAVSDSTEEPKEWKRVYDLFERCFDGPYGSNGNPNWRLNPDKDYLVLRTICELVPILQCEGLNVC